MSIKIKRPRARPAGSGAARANRYTPKDKPWEMDLPVEPLNNHLQTFNVPCIRKGGTPGIMNVLVDAETPEQAVELLLSGSVSGIGLGWQPLPEQITLHTPGTPIS